MENKETWMIDFYKIQFLSKYIDLGRILHFAIWKNVNPSQSCVDEYGVDFNVSLSPGTTST